MNKQQTDNRANQLNPNHLAYHRSRQGNRSPAADPGRTCTRKAPEDARADIHNGNKGSAGTNLIYDKAQGNRGKQLNPNQAPSRQRR